VPPGPDPAKEGTLVLSDLMLSPLFWNGPMPGYFRAEAGIYTNLLCGIIAIPGEVNDLGQINSGRSFLPQDPLPIIWTAISAASDLCF